METNIRAGAANVGISSAAPAGVSPGVWELGAAHLAAGQFFVFYQ